MPPTSRRSRAPLPTQTPPEGGTEPRRPASTTEPRGHLRPGSTAEDIVRDVVRGLYEGRLVAGQRLSEPDLVATYGVGRSTVREAIVRLAAEGVVETKPFQSAQIRQLSRSEARDTLLVLESVIGLAARLAAERIEEGDRRRTFESSLRRLIDVEDEDSYEQVRARNGFYRAMVAVSGNRELARLLPSIQVHLTRSYLRLSRDKRRRDYADIASAILDRNADSAEAAARSHIARTIEALERLPDDTFAPEREASPIAGYDD